MAELHFFTGTMDSGKSTLALQTNHNHAARGRVGRIFTTHDRSGQAVLSSRLGLTHDALEVDSGFDFWKYVVDSLTREDAIGRGWFGAVQSGVLPRLGDVMVACHDDAAVMSSRDFAYEDTLVGLHGSLTSTELLIPILVG